MADADDRTTRERIRAHLARTTATPSGLADQFDLDREAALDHVGHVARSLRPSDAELLVRPPTCRDCGFDEFDDRLNVPSRCPDCRSEAVAEPAFRVE